MKPLLYSGLLGAAIAPTAERDFVILQHKASWYER